MVGTGGLAEVFGQGAGPRELGDVIDSPTALVERAAVGFGQLPLDEGVGAAVAGEQFVDDRPEGGGGLGDALEAVGRWGR